MKKWIGVMKGVACLVAMTTVGACFGVERTTVPLHKIRIGGYLGERFDTCLRGNVLKLDLEKDFFSPFLRREGKGGFVGLGKHADAAVHFAWNTKDPAAIDHKEKVIGFIVGNQLPDGYTGCFAETNRLAKLWDIHEMGFIIQGLMSDWELFGNRAVVSTVEWAVGIDNVAVDEGRESKNVCAVELRPFWHEDRTLTYFRAPNIRRDCREQDELFGLEAK